MGGGHGLHCVAPSTGGQDSFYGMLAEGGQTGVLSNFWDVKNHAVYRA